MSSTSTLSTVPTQVQRITPMLDTRHKIILYDRDNAYPQRMLKILQASATGIACRDTFVRFVVGDGFEDETFPDYIINRKKQSISELHRQLVTDLANSGSFHVHCNYNLLGEITELNRIDPKYVRLGLPDSNQYSTKVALFDNWDGYNYTVNERREPVYIDVFNPEFAGQQIALAGSIGAYKGQVFSYWGEEQAYPLTMYDSVSSDLKTEAAIGNRNLRNQERSFTAKQAVIFPDVMDPEDRNRHKQAFRQAQGPDGDDILIVDGVGENGVRFEKLHTNDDAGHSQVSEDSRMKIYRAWSQPAILHDETGKQNSLGDGQMLQQAHQYYNDKTRDYRKIFTESFAEIFSRYAWDVNQDDNYVIKPLSFNEGMTAQKAKDIAELLQMPFSPEQKRAMLIGLHGMSEMKAEMLTENLTTAPDDNN